MAANMMEILKQINRNINIIDGKVSELDKKMDQQQITIDRLEHQVKKNNTLLFGNDEADIHLQNKATNKSDLVDKKNEIDLVDESEEYVGNTEIKRLQNSSTVSFSRMCQTEAYCECDNKKNDDINTQHIVLESITNELKEIKDFLRDFGAAMKSMSLDKDNVVQMPPTCLNADQIIKLRKELKRHCDEIKDLIKDAGAIKKTTREAVSTDKKAEEKKDDKKEADIVQISPTYFSADQVTKLNKELRRIAKIYRSTNTFPIIEVTPGGHEHPVMKQLRNGVQFKNYYSWNMIKIKLGVEGYERSEVHEKLNEYPDLTLVDVVKELLRSRKWKPDIKVSDYNFRDLLPYDP